jgi:DNA-binding NarL/FixJ family response regulator
MSSPADASDLDKPIRILLVEDNILTRLGTATVIRTQSDMQIVGEASDGSQAISKARALLPDVVLLDLNLPIMSGVQVAQALCSDDPPPSILVLSQYEGGADVLNALRAGARGYATKDTDVEGLLEGIRTVARGERYLPAKIAETLAAQAELPALAPRDLRVLEKLYLGFTNKMIADALNLTERSAGAYVGQVIAKLGARTRQEAVAIAIRQRLLLPK